MKQNKFILAITMFLLISCQKEFLEIKPNKALLVPTTLVNFQALLDNISVMNANPSLTLLSSDEYVVIDNGLANVKDFEKNTYLWRTDLLSAEVALLDWYYPYQQVFYANVVLDGLEKLTPSKVDAVAYNNVKGAALFYRALAFYNLVQIFAPAYDESNAERLRGIPLRLTADVNLRPLASTLTQTYSQITRDFELASSLLPKKAVTKNRPSWQAATAALARTYLVMGKYELAMAAAAKALDFDDKLINYNTIRQGVSLPFPEPLPFNNEEVIYNVQNIGYSFFSANILRVDSKLLQIYEPNDLRPKIFFFATSKGGISNKNYEGLCNDEMYLIVAECLFRKGEFNAGSDYLNRLRINRFLTGSYVPVSFDNEITAIQYIIAERQRELFGRSGLRWSDLKRLNKDSRFVKDLERNYNGTIYTLRANDKAYIFPFPDE